MCQGRITLHQGEEPNMRKIALSFIGYLGLSAVAIAGPGEHFIENWDLNGDGAVSAEEARERRSDVFASFDADDDGYIDAEEYKTFDEARALDQEQNGDHGMGRGRNNPANGMRLEANDADGDGRVSREEFLDRAASWIRNIDRNGDGVVTTADFGRRS